MQRDVDGLAFVPRRRVLTRLTSRDLLGEFADVHLPFALPERPDGEPTTTVPQNVVDFPLFQRPVRRGGPSAL